MKINTTSTPNNKKGGDTNNIWEITILKIIVITTIFLVSFDNCTFFKNVLEYYPISAKNIGFLLSLALVLASILILLFTVFCLKYIAKPILIVILLASSLASYFMNKYNIVIDDTMIQNVMETNINEALDLLSFKLILYFSFAGILPSIIVYKMDIIYKSFKNELISRLLVIITMILVILLLTFSFSKHYTSFFREHKPLRYYTNPTYFLYSIGEYIAKRLNNNEIKLTSIGTDAKIPETDIDRELIILVIGEAARADRFSLNGYQRETNPLLKKEDIINLPNMYSCGTSTSVSLPCMFSIFKREEFNEKQAESTENIIDILSHAGVNILWRDNNSDSKGIALRVLYEDFKDPKKNPICDIECRDEGMLVGLEEYIEKQKKGDILIVLHQMGNHGPAYYKRYPKSFEVFTPVCETNQLEECTEEEINNAYDNAILYTDYFLSKVINLLKKYSDRFEAAMFYISDHGESLGEKNVYLHGLPFFMAPEAQKHIAAFMWFGDGFNIDKDAIRKKSSREYSQDNIFHTLLGLMEIETGVYNISMDIVNTID